MMDDLEVVVKLKPNVVYWLFEVLTLLVIVQAINDGE